MAEANDGVSSLKTTLTFLRVGTCSGALFNVLNRAFDDPLKPEEDASSSFAGGVLQHGYQCGMIWGAALAAGARAVRVLGTGPRAEVAAVVAAGRIVEAFRGCTGHINCVDITDLDKSSSTLQQVVYFLVKGGSIGCFRMAARYAPVAFEVIDSSLSSEPGAAPEPDAVPEPPVSCASIVAERLGASDEQRVMASGLAGGIGLCGGACGALGAAIWILGMKAGREKGRKDGYKDPRAGELVSRFLEHTDFRFECSEIVGRTFDAAEDHAAYLRDGGCSDLIETIASE